MNVDGACRGHEFSSTLKACLSHHVSTLGFPAFPECSQSVPSKLQTQGATSIDRALPITPLSRPSEQFVGNPRARSRRCRFLGWVAAYEADARTDPREVLKALQSRARAR